MAAPAAAPPTAPTRAPTPAPLALSVSGSKPVCCLAHLWQSAVSQACLSAVWPFCGYTYALNCATEPDAQPDIPTATLINETQINDRNPTRFITEPSCTT